jgi:methenyltetrahydrofolate cyclohydrolase
VTGFQELPLAAFGEELASGSATPGGGCAAALAGALAAGLVAMVARNTAASKSFSDRAERMSDVAADADSLRSELLQLVDADAAAFDEVMAAFRLPKETPEQQAVRAEAIQQGYRAAVEPPLRVCTESVRVLELAVVVAEQGSPNAVSDAGVATHLAGAALEGGALNVEINLDSIGDEAFRTSRAEEVRAARAQGGALREQALAAVQAKLG